MKLCRFGSQGAEKPGMIDQDGRLRDLSGIIEGLSAVDLTPERLRNLRSVDITRLPIVFGDQRLGVPFEGTSKIVCIGLNYSDHAKETGLSIPTEPIIFLKSSTAISGPTDNVVKPLKSTKMDWEVELGVVIGTRAHCVSESSAMEHVAGYCVVNDVSERAFQLQSSQWDKGKSCDTFAPIGPWLVTRDELGHPQSLDMWLDVNGVRMQEGNTRTMIFGVAELVAYCSHYMTLLPGDVIATGTPPGVGMGKKPNPIWLEAGDVVSLGIEGLGSQRQQIVAWSDPAVESVPSPSIKHAE